VRHWFFAVWNEPSLTAFRSGKQNEYFELYRYTGEAIKGVDCALQRRGPATADNAGVDDFLEFCHCNRLAVDFVTTRHDPTDAYGRPGDDTDVQLSDSKRSVVREEAGDDYAHEFPAASPFH
jgi:xylan 1,4-beta-xylosidase